MNGIAWSQNRTAERAAAQGVEAVAKEALFRQADFVTLHLRLSDRSRGLVDAEMLSLMKPDAWVVNTSRGPIVDRAALLAALQAKRIGGRSEEHTSELQSLMRISYAVFCLKKKKDIQDK